MIATLRADAAGGMGPGWALLRRAQAAALEDCLPLESREDVSRLVATLAFCEGEEQEAQDD